nr:protein trichome birefringence-like 12 [Ipomoea batatas]
MAYKLNPKLFAWLILLAFMLVIFYSAFIPLYTPSSPSSSQYSKLKLSISSSCNLVKGQSVFDPARKPMYDDNFPFHRNAWNCTRNHIENMGRINSWIVANKEYVYGHLQVNKSSKQRNYRHVFEQIFAFSQGVSSPPGLFKTEELLQRAHVQSGASPELGPDAAAGRCAFLLHALFPSTECATIPTCNPPPPFPISSPDTPPESTRSSNSGMLLTMLIISMPTIR